MQILTAGVSPDSDSATSQASTLALLPSKWERSEQYQIIRDSSFRLPMAATIPVGKSCNAQQHLFFTLLATYRKSPCLFTVIFPNQIYDPCPKQELNPIVGGKGAYRRYWLAELPMPGRSLLLQIRSRYGGGVTSSLSSNLQIQGAISEVRTHSDATQSEPTCSRLRLGACYIYYSK